MCTLIREWRGGNLPPPLDIYTIEFWRCAEHGDPSYRMRESSILSAKGFTSDLPPADVILEDNREITSLSREHLFAWLDARLENGQGKGIVWTVHNLEEEV